MGGKERERCRGGEREEGVERRRGWEGEGGGGERGGERGREGEGEGGGGGGGRRGGGERETHTDSGAVFPVLKNVLTRW